MAEILEPKESGSTYEVEVDFSQPWDLSDVVFLMEDDTKVYAIKSVMVMWSPVMRAMFFGDFKEKEGKVILPGKKYADILELVKVLHPPNKKLDVNNVPVLLPLAREYQMEKLTDNCHIFLLSQPPSMKNLVLADEFSLLSLQTSCLEYAENIRISELLKESAFHQLLNETKFEICKDKSLRYEHILYDILKIAKGKADLPLGTTWACTSSPGDDWKGSRHNKGQERGCKMCKLWMMDNILKTLEQL